MILAHVQQMHAPAGTPWRLAAALPSISGPRHDPDRWLDLERARRRLLAEDPERGHNSALFRMPLTTLDAHLAAGLRVAALAELVEGFVRRGADHGANDGADDDALLETADLRFGPPILRPPSLRDFYAFEGHVATMWARRGNPVPEAWYRLPIFYFSNTSEIRGPGDPVWAPRGSTELDYELEVCALVDTPARDLSAEQAEAAIGGYLILNDWSARDLQRDETTVRLGPAKGKDFASSIGPWLVTPDELADARAPGANGPELSLSAEVNGVELSRGSWSGLQFSFGQMLVRASADAALRPGDLIGSGTVGGGCLLEVREATLGRYLQPGDEVVLRVERLGALATPIVARPS
ncbi:MAG TPA: fumarylacetoacetate hydrolase family protein [Candidatus Limnocylindrales bacterium]|nr:fumarylacetoacetate hydrolase family protein [Candidatus Limnocylindrales bacterium]